MHGALQRQFAMDDSHKPLELDLLMLAHADVGLVLVDPASGRMERLNPAWPQWLGHSVSFLQEGVFWDECWWQQHQVVRTLISLTSLPLPMPAMSVSALTHSQELLSLVLSARPVDLGDRRLVLCTLVRENIARQHPVSSSVAEAAMMGVVQTLITVLEVHDPDSIGHQRRVADLAGTMARRLHWPAAEVQAVELAALIHDIGMVTVPARVLGKREFLSADEVRQIQKHVKVGVDMVRHIDFPGPVTALMAQHHERINGSGYPAGLKGQEVLRGAQLIGMADMLDAMTRDRPYQPAQTMAQALGTLLAAAGVLFDADLVKACIDLFEVDGYRFPVV